ERCGDNKERQAQTYHALNHLRTIHGFSPASRWCVRRSRPASSPALTPAIHRKKSHSCEGMDTRVKPAYDIHLKLDCTWLRSHEKREVGHAAMEELRDIRSKPATAATHCSAVPWRDLRDWLTLVDNAGRLLRIKQPVDPDQELAAITFMATRRENAPALLFETLGSDRFGARVLANMLGSSKERYALAVGLDPDLSTAEMIAATRNMMSRRIAPVHVPATAAPVNEIILRESEIDLTAFPAP